MSLASSSDRKRELPSPRDGPPRWRSQAQASLACSLMLGLNNRGALSTPKGQCLRRSCRSSSLPKHARAFDAPPSASRTVVGPHTPRPSVQHASQQHSHPSHSRLSRCHKHLCSHRQEGTRAKDRLCDGRPHLPQDGRQGRLRPSEPGYRNRHPTILYRTCTYSLRHHHVLRHRGLLDAGAGTDQPTHFHLPRIHFVFPGFSVLSSSTFGIWLPCPYKQLPGSC